MPNKATRKKRILHVLSCLLILCCSVDSSNGQLGNSGKKGELTLEIEGGEVKDRDSTTKSKRAYLLELGGKCYVYNFELMRNLFTKETDSNHSLGMSLGLGLAWNPTLIFEFGLPVSCYFSIGKKING